MGEKLIFSILKEIYEKNHAINGKLYNLKEYEFIQIIRWIVDSGWLRGAIIIADEDRVLLGGAKVTKSGMEFLQTFHEWFYTYPEQKNLYKWISNQSPNLINSSENDTHRKKTIIEMDYEKLKDRIYSIAFRIEQLGGQVHELYIGETADKSEVAELESDLGFQLPSEFAEVMIKFSANFSFSWSFPEDIEKERNVELNRIDSGSLHWNIKNLIQLEQERQDWLDVFETINDPCYPIWEDKLLFCKVGNGDFLALDINGCQTAQVVYLDHEGGEFHGTCMASDFFALLENWSRVAFVGPEAFQWSIFTNNPKSGIVGECNLARQFRSWLNLKV